MDRALTQDVGLIVAGGLSDVGARAAAAAFTRLAGVRHGTDPAAASDALAQPDAPDWWLLVDRAAQPAPGLVSTLLAELGRLPDGTGAYSDFYLDLTGGVAAAGAAALARADVGAWSKERARWQDYTGSVALVRSEALRAAIDEGVDPAAASSSLRHRALVQSALLGSVAYAREPLYTVPRDVIGPVGAAERAGMLTLQRAGFTLPGGLPPRQLAQWPGVSIVIPTRGGRARVGGRTRRLIDVTMRSFIDTTRQLQPEFVLVVDDDVPYDYVDPWQGELGDRLRIVATSPPFNFSAKVNAGIAAASGDVVAIMNDDMSAITDTWLDNLVAAACEPDVGAVGAMLLLESGDIQHAGHHYTATGPYLLDVGRPLGPGPRGRNACDRDVTGVTAACLVQRKEVWDQVGGLAEEFPVSFNDVDYCERIALAGYRIVQCNSSRLFHYESRTRRRGATEDEIELFVQRLGHRLAPDPMTPYEPPPKPHWRQQASYRWDKLRSTWAAGGASGVLAALRTRGGDDGPAG